MTGLECVENLCRALSVFAPQWKSRGGVGYYEEDDPIAAYSDRAAWVVPPPVAGTSCPRCGWPEKERICGTCRHRSDGEHCDQPWHGYGDGNKGAFCDCDGAIYVDGGFCCRHWSGS